VEWEGTRYRWEQIDDYEVAVGYLRIKPVEEAAGTEFLRRLSEELEGGTPAAQAGRERAAQGAASMSGEEV
jgi:hypothetical protein